MLYFSILVAEMFTGSGTLRALASNGVSFSRWDICSVFCDDRLWEPVVAIILFACGVSVSSSSLLGLGDAGGDGLVANHLRWG